MALGTVYVTITATEPAGNFKIGVTDNVAYALVVASAFPELTYPVADQSALDTWVAGATILSGWTIEPTFISGGYFSIEVTAPSGNDYEGLYIQCCGVLATFPDVLIANLLTIKDTPQQYDPVHNDLPFIVSGTNNTQANYKYWMDVYFPGSTAYDYRLFTFPRPDGFGFFNLKTILRDYVTGDIDIPTVETFYRNSSMYKAYNVYFGESYGTTGAITSGMVSSGTYYTYDGSLEWAEWITYLQNDRAIRTTGKAKFMTNQPQATSTNLNSYQVIGDSENAWLYMAVKESNAVAKIYIETFDVNGSSLGFYTIANPYVTLNNDDNRFLRFPSGTANIPRIPSADITVISGSLPIITSSVVYYEMATNAAAGGVSSYGAVYKVQSNCSKYDAYRLHYKNKWGGFDSFTFTMVNRESGEIERKSYKKMYGTISSDGDWDYTKKERGLTNYSTKAKRKLMLKSDWVTEAQYELLIELIESPQVYWDDSGELFAVNILNSSYEIKTVKNDKVFNLEIEVEFTQMNRRQ